ncbi:hypothetical protein [Leptospira sp. id769339]|uniref:hypothetical protein n=1 Tax=Leptospira sp. id769339 TaxID=2864221 RepID=UPI00214CD35A|nr:hypothetical protein [Leptospira sp. id769339]MCR1794872.1 hypothetical protein [Leptospira sp. id769339]
MKKFKDLDSQNAEQGVGTEAQRLLFAAQKVGFDEVEEKVGLKQHKLQRWARTNAEIDELILNELLIECGISKFFVRTGKGRWKASTDEIFARFEELIETVKFQKGKENTQQSRIVTLIDKLSSRDRELIIAMCYKLIQEQRNSALRAVLTMIFNFPKSFFENIHRFLLDLEKKLFD